MVHPLPEQFHAPARAVEQRRRRIERDHRQREHQALAVLAGSSPGTVFASSRTAPAVASSRPGRWLYPLKRSPWYMVGAQYESRVEWAAALLHRRDMRPESIATRINRCASQKGDFMPAFSTVLIDRDLRHPAHRAPGAQPPGEAQCHRRHHTRRHRHAVEWAQAEDEVHVIVVEGAGASVLRAATTLRARRRRAAGPIIRAGRRRRRGTRCFDYAAHEAQHRGLHVALALPPSRPSPRCMAHAVAGGSDIALCCDLR